MFENKKSNFAKSKIEPNFEIANNKEWSPKEIDARQKQFAKIALKIWSV
ncbi:GmrSD restriction endonuclease domain-containing protein [Sharpea azabuensis]